MRFKFRNSYDFTHFESSPSLRYNCIILYCFIVLYMCVLDGGKVHFEKRELPTPKNSKLNKVNNSFLTIPTNSEIKLEPLTINLKK